MWQMLADFSQAEQYVRQAEARCHGEGVEKVAAHIVQTLSEAKERAFEEERDPITRRGWAPPSASLLQDRSYRRLLERSGELRGATQAGYELVPIGARVKMAIEGPSDIVRYGMVHLYGVKARARRSNRARRKRPEWSLPRRRFIGIHREEIGAVVEFAEKSLLPESD